MGLVICPECYSEISQYSEICTNCGFPIQNFLKKHNINDIDKVFICPQCANVSYFGFQREGVPLKLKCEYCNIPVVQTNESPSELFRTCVLNVEEFKNKSIDIAKKYGDNQFSQEAYDKFHTKLHQKNIEHDNNYKKQFQQQNIPKCPICQSTDLSKISSTKKVAKVGLFGIFGAGDIGKTWKCNNCGSKF